jgi:ABC-type dipeptide/oligopeptide/nickel transport system permease component
MLRTVAARLLDAVPTVLLVLTLVFAALRLLPGDPALVVLGEYATQEQLALFRSRLGLDQPLWRQYLAFIVDMVTLDYGTSMINEAPVAQLLADNLPYTIELTLAATGMGVSNQ